MRAVVLMLLVAVAAAAGATLSDELIEEEWNAFKLQHQKSYQDEAEEKYRMKIFAEKRHTVNEHNKRYERGEVTYTMGINKFSDLLADEFYNMMTGLKEMYEKTRSNLEDADNKGAMFIPSDHVPVPDSVDWRKKGAVTPVKSQGLCIGASWAFAATGALESQYLIHKKKNVSLSTQHLIDCSKNDACGGGDAIEAYNFIIANGIATEDSYPYYNYVQPCRYSEAKRGATMVNYTRLPWGDEKALIQAVATVGPVAAVMSPPPQDYHGGVYHNPYCGNMFVSQAVLVVGYGKDKKSGLDYWIVKNSWGKDWGDAGYMLLAREEFHTCGITNSASYPII